MVVEARDPRQPDSVDVEVGRRVRVERIARGLSQTELAKQIGVTFQQVQKYEKGRNRISMGRLARIGHLFGVDVTYLLGASGGKKPPAIADPRERANASEVMRMLGRSGALRLLRAFVAIPTKPPVLRESILQTVEGIASAATSKTRKRTKRK
jgi:transcriptional regulator with XRE-family HTH domain